MAESVDTIIHARWVVPVVPRGTVLQDHAVVVDGGRIKDILPSVAASAKYTAREEGNGKGVIHVENHHALMPGLVNAHTHSPMSLLRGYADDVSVMEWLQQIWKVEGRWVGPEFVKDGTKLSIAEMIRTGTTCFNDMYYFPDVTATVAKELGMRCTVGVPIIGVENNWVKGEEGEDLSHRCYDVARQLHAAYEQDELVRVSIAPHAPYTVTDEQFKDISALAAELGVKIHIHVHESEKEISDSIEQYGCRPIERLERLKFWGSNVIAVHMTQATDDEIALLKKHDVCIVHCPESNMKLCSGRCRARCFLGSGVTVAIGTDGAASNDDLDMMGELRTAALVDKAQANPMEAIDAAHILEMATLHGARALGIDSEVGSIEVGKAADLVAVRLMTEPVYNPISHLVYVGTNGITHVWVNGQPLLVEGKFVRMDEDELLRVGKQWAEKITST